MAFRDRQPACLHHIQLIPKVHIGKSRSGPRVVSSHFSDSQCKETDQTRCRYGYDSAHSPPYLSLKPPLSKAYGEYRKRYPRQASSATHTPQVNTFYISSNVRLNPTPRFKDGVPHTPIQQCATSTFTRAGPALYLIYTAARVPRRERLWNVRKGLQLVFRSRSDDPDPGQGLDRWNPPMLIVLSFCRNGSLTILLPSHCASYCACCDESLQVVSADAWDHDCTPGSSLHISYTTCNFIHLTHTYIRQPWPSSYYRIPRYPFVFSHDEI